MYIVTNDGITFLIPLKFCELSCADSDFFSAGGGGRGEIIFVGPDMVQSLLYYRAGWGGGGTPDPF